MWRGGTVLGLNYPKTFPQQKSLKRNRTKEAIGKQFEQVLSAIPVLLFYVKKTFPQAVAHPKKSFTIYMNDEKNSRPRKYTLTTPSQLTPQKNNGLSLRPRYKVKLALQEGENNIQKHLNKLRRKPR